MFDARLWANTVERYSRNFAHQKIVDVANGQLTFRSATTLDHETRSMIVHEWFDLTGETQESVENVFVMRPWTPAELTASMDRNGIRQLRSARGYCAADNWTDRMVVIASNL